MSMSVSQLIKELQKCDPHKTILVNGETIQEVNELFFVGSHVELITAPVVEESEDDFFTALAEEVEQGAGEMLDAMKINGVG